ncbi:tetraspanin-11-like [Symsagittifera roscoffensis]|uniref:tetraspanin-11-like n=1 Tax=Symsagittifera roscoffensis TaxID=84072 RepID=UPI00307C18C0
MCDSRRQHQEQKCCGVQHYDDWKYSKWVKIRNQERNVTSIDDENFAHAPDSCCKTVLDNCGTMAHPNNFYEHGCLKQIVDFFERNLLVLSIAAVFVLMIQLVALVSSLLLLNKLRKKNIWEWYRGLAKATQTTYKVR